MTRPSLTNISHPRYVRFALFFVASLGLAAVGAVVTVSAVMVTSSTKMN